MKRSAFLSYPHKDALEFARRLEFALGMYMDVFRDIRLSAGEFWPQLDKEIEERDYFIFVMTPYSAPEDSACRRELRHAEKHGRKIAPVRIHLEHHDKELVDKYTYADFSEDFDQGFRRLTQLTLGAPFSSWEYLTTEPDDRLLVSLENGRLPGLIAKEIGEWVLIERLWPFLNKHPSANGIAMGSPRTLVGMSREFKPIYEQLARDRKSAGTTLLDRVKRVAEPYWELDRSIKDSNHVEAGKNASTAIKGTKDCLRTSLTTSRDFSDLALLDARYEFDVAEKLREFIAVHSRRSRYLY